MIKQNPLPLPLIKFGKYKHMKDFRQNGILYMNTLDYFKTWEERDAVGDEDEGLDYFYQLSKVDMTFSTSIGTKTFPAADATVGNVKIYRNDVGRFNLFCLFSIRKPLATPLIDPRNLVGFGDTFVMILNVPEFCRRLKVAAEKENVGMLLRGKAVEYVNDDYNGEMDAFKKFKKYEYQSEYRFVIEPGFGRHYELTIGDISDISSIGNAEDLKNVTMLANPG
jgi:hypothetical protein